MKDQRVAALIPCFDAAATVGAVVEGAREFVETVVVVDDGSQDASAAVAEAAGAEVLRQPGNGGKGSALQRGFDHLAAGGVTHAFTLDADGQHFPSEMPRLLEKSAQDPATLFLGARRREGVHDIAPMKRFGNDFADWWVSVAAKQEIYDSQSGFRIYPLVPLAGILAGQVAGRHFEFESELLILAARCGVAIESVDIDVHYPPPEERHSHYAPWLDTIRIIRMVAPFVFGQRG